MTTDQSAHAQAAPIAKGEEEFFPVHPPRTETPEYRQTHQQLVKVNDLPCEICGVRNSTLADPTKNTYKASALETHHFPIQREYFDACDWKKVQLDFPKYITDQDSFKNFVDSPYNMKVICSYHHRHPQNGIHHTITNDWVIQKYLLDGYILNDTFKNEAVDILKDTRLTDEAIAENERL